MGWANCGTDSRGRQIGYAHRGHCDEPGCHKRIDRGLAYACGGMHGEDVHYCEGYFCPDHLEFPNLSDAAWEEAAHDMTQRQLCRRCRRRYELAKQPRDVRGRFATVEVS